MGVHCARPQQLNGMYCSPCPQSASPLTCPVKRDGAQLPTNTGGCLCLDQPFPSDVEPSRPKAPPPPHFLCRLRTRLPSQPWCLLRVMVRLPLPKPPSHPSTGSSGPESSSSAGVAQKAFGFSSRSTRPAGLHHLRSVSVQGEEDAIGEALERPGALPLIR